MSIATMKEKIIYQAAQLNALQAELNYLIKELYKLNPSHELFEKSPEMAKSVKDAIEIEKRIESAKAPVADAVETKTPE
jgi:hypothetical protein